MIGEWSFITCRTWSYAPHGGHGDIEINTKNESGR
jgi:hypothetical protein